MFYYMRNVKKETVVVGMSGGVDSSTVAAILCEDYNVIGVTLQLYDQVDATKAKSCCGSRDIHDAKKVATHLGISHYTINLTAEFRRNVIDHFTSSYKKGITPIPCIECNKSVKFTDMLRIAHEIGAQYVATGHYARRIQNGTKFELHSGIDQTKDQTYFLYATTQEQLSKTLFPLGGYTKVETRKIAEDFGIPIAHKTESQDICFIPDGDYSKFLIKEDSTFLNDGDIIRKDTGEIVGQHKGASFYTKGQRRGIGVGGNGIPLYVVETDIKNNIVYIGPNDMLLRQNLEISNVNFINEEYRDKDIFECDVILRALTQRIPAIIQKIDNDKYSIQLQTDGRAITQGQACVMYSQTQVIGGGMIL